MNTPNLSSPAGQGESSQSAGSIGALKGTPQGGYAAQTPADPQSSTPELVKQANAGK